MDGMDTVMSANENQKPDPLTELFGKPLCALTSNSTDKDSHYEEAGSVGEEMKLHQDKMDIHKGVSDG